jgi:general secretion pathway protein D
LREDERRTLQGIPGLLRLPVLRNLLASNDTQIDQTDIIMLLTPRIVRTQELTLSDVSPIFIGSQQSLGLGGPPPLIAAPAGDATPEPAPVAAAPAGQPVPPAGQGVVVVPPGSSPIPGTTTVPAAPAQPVPSPAGPGAAATPGAPGAPAGGAPPVAPAATAGGGGGQIILTPPGPEFRVGAGPYTVPISIMGASQVSSVSITLTFNSATLRVRSVQEGSFMRAGGIAATFTQQVDAAAGRVDIAIVRPGDATGVAGTGLLGAVLFDAVGGGPANFSITGSAAAPRGTPVQLQFNQPPVVTIR